MVSSAFSHLGNDWHNGPIFINSNYKTTTVFVMDEFTKLPVQVFRVAANREYVVKEFETIKYLLGYSGIANYLPTPLGLEARSYRPISSYKFIEGEPIKLGKRFRIKAFQKYFKKTFPFLGELASIPVPEFLNNYDEDMERKKLFLQSVTKRDASVMNILNFVRESSEHLCNAKVSKVIVHGDLNSSNILLSLNNAKIIDWEFATAGYPLTDLVYLVLSSLRSTPLNERGTFLLKLIRDEALLRNLGVEIKQLVGPGLSEKCMKSLLNHAIFYFYFKELYYKAEEWKLLEPTFLILERLSLNETSTLLNFQNEIHTNNK